MVTINDRYETTRLLYTKAMQDAEQRVLTALEELDAAKLALGRSRRQLRSYDEDHAPRDFHL